MASANPSSPGRTVPTAKSKSPKPPATPGIRYERGEFGEYLRVQDGPNDTTFTTIVFKDDWHG